MKWFLLLIITLNLAIFAYGKINKDAESNKSIPNFNAQNIKILPANWSENKQNTLPSASVPIVTLPASRQPKHNKLSARTECFKWGSLKQHLVTRIQGGLPELNLNASQIKIVKQTTNSQIKNFYLVYLPESSDREENDRLSNRLSSSGFQNVSVKKDGEYILSLGRFSEENNANNLLKKLIDAGFSDASIKGKGEQESIIFFSQITKEQKGKLEILQHRLTPGITTKKISCNKIY